MKSECASLAIFILGLLISPSLSYSIQDEEFIVETKKVLTPEEKVLANQARAEIAKAVENNLIRIFAIITAQNEHPHPRQDDDGDIEDLVPTPNPNVLPQVAQILGAIFSGTLNITRIADGTVGLVPNFVRKQLQGLVKLLTGETVNLSGSSTTTTPAPTANKIRQTTEVDTIFEEEPASGAPPQVVYPGGEVAPAQNPPTNAQQSLVVEGGEGGNKTKYRVRTKVRRTTTISPDKVVPPVDDEIERIERDLRAAARILEPYENKEPRFYAGMFTNVLQNVNMTEVTKAVPSIFKGATQAILLLENLGVLDTLPGAEALENLEDLVDLDID